MKDTAKDAALARDDELPLAYHEAGHQVVSHVLSKGRQRTASFVLRAEDRMAPAYGGLAYMADLPPTPAAIATMAGPLAEALAIGVTPPRRSVAKAQKATTVEAIGEKSMAGVAADHKAATPDKRAIAAYCVTGFEDSPEEWLGRYQHVRQEAHLMVQALAPAIHEVAKELFLEGAVLPTRLDAILETETRAGRCARALFGKVPHMTETLQERIQAMKLNSPERAALVSAAKAGAPEQRLFELGEAACLTKNEVIEVSQGIARARACKADADQWPSVNKEWLRIEEALRDVQKKLGRATCDDDRAPLLRQQADLAHQRDVLQPNWSRCVVAAQCFAALKADGLAD